MAVLARGDVFVVAVLLVVVARRPAATAAAFLAAGTVLLRWGSPSLDALAGAQAVFGPALAVGSSAEAVSAGCAAGALLLATPPVHWPRRHWPPPAVLVVVAPFALSAALVAAGPAAGGGFGAFATRVAATLAAALVSLAVMFSTSVPGRRTAPIARRIAGFGAAGAGVAALTLAAIG